MANANLVSQTVDGAPGAAFRVSAERALNSIVSADHGGRFGSINPPGQGGKNKVGSSKVHVSSFLLSMGTY
jgi:hypothetical protein